MESTSHKSMKRLLLNILVLLVGTVIVKAGYPAKNIPFVKANEDGQVYLKAIPQKELGDEGKTVVYRVGPGKDSVACTLKWYSRTVYLESLGRDVSVVRLFYANDKSRVRDDYIQFYVSGK